MWRTLRPGGRLAVAVWAGLDACPGYTAFIDLLRRMFGAEAANTMRAPFALGDPVELDKLFEEAQVGPAVVTTHAGTARFPSLEWWITADGKGWLLERYVDDAGLARLLEEATTELAEFVTDGGRVEFSMPAHVVQARKV